MNRRSFLSGFAALIGAQALEQIPGNRVWSFPSKIVIKKTPSVAQAIGLMHDIVRPELPKLFESEVGLFGIRYIQYEINNGAWLGLSRKSYPGIKFPISELSVPDSLDASLHPQIIESV